MKERGHRPSFELPELNLGVWTQPHPTTIAESLKQIEGTSAALGPLSERETWLKAAH